MIDATGVGQAMYDMLKHHYATEIEKGELEILEFIATSETNHDGYQRMLLDLQNERIEYPNSERAKSLAKQRAFVQQMTNLQKMYRGAYLGAEAGEMTPYKDFCSSLMMGLLAADNSGAMPEIEQEESMLSVGEGARGSRRGLAHDRERPAWGEERRSRHYRN